MPKSKVRDKTKRRRTTAAQREQDRMLRRGRETDWRKRVGWVLVALGGVAFIGGNIGARTGLMFLPFDPHHMFTQLGGAAIGMTGLMWALGR